MSETQNPPVDETAKKIEQISSFLEASSRVDKQERDFYLSTIRNDPSLLLKINNGETVEFYHGGNKVVILPKDYYTMCLLQITSV